jgi:hypothetical protein
MIGGVQSGSQPCLFWISRPLDVEQSLLGCILGEWLLVLIAAVDFHKSEASHK